VRVHSQILTTSYTVQLELDSQQVVGTPYMHTYTQRTHIDKQTRKTYCQHGIQDGQWQGRLNQWAHWARAQGPGLFLFEGPPTGCGEINFFKLIILQLPLMKPSSG